MTVAERQQARKDRAAMRAAQTEAQKAQVAAAISARTVPQTSERGQHTLTIANNSMVEPHIDGVPLSQMAAPLRAKHAAQAEELRNPPFKTIEEARRAAQILQAHAEDWDPERLKNGWARVKRFIVENPEAIEALKAQETTEEAPAAEPQPEEEAPKRELSYFEKVRETIGLMMGASRDSASALGVVANSAAAESIAGARGAADVVGKALAGSVGWGDGASVDEAVQVIDEWRDALTFMPMTEGGRKILQGIAAPLTKLDEVAMDVSEIEGQGNEWASTAIYTTIMGLPDVLGFKGGSVLKASKRIAQANKIAQKLGIKPVTQTMPSDIIDAARKMGSDVAAANMGRLQQAMQEAKAGAVARIDELKKHAASRRAFVNTAQANEFAVGFERSIREQGFDLDNMPKVQARLQEIKGLQFVGNRTPSEPTPQLSLLNMPANQKVKARRVQDWLQVRNRIEKDLETKKDNQRLPTEVNERQVLETLMKDMDDNLLYQFNQDMIHGNPESIKVWREHTEARAYLNDTFNEDKIIRKMIETEVSPEQLKRWLIGANGANAIPQMASTMKRIKTILGPNHPAIRGVQLDFMYDVVKPLFSSKGPDFEGLVRNIDNVVKGRKEVVDALDLDVETLMGLRNFAQISLKHPPSKPVKLVKDVSMALSRMMPWAHAISKAGLKVTFMANVFRKIAGEAPVAQKRILAELAQAQFGGPVFDPRSLWAGRALQAAFLADFGEIAKDEDVERP